MNDAASLHLSREQFKTLRARVDLVNRGLPTALQVHNLVLWDNTGMRTLQAFEGLAFLILHARIVFRGLIPNETLYTIARVAELMELALKPCKTLDETFTLDLLARTVIDDYIEHCCNKDSSQLPPCFHMLLHIGASIRECGDVSNYDMFAYERFHQVICLAGFLWLSVGF